MSIQSAIDGIKTSKENIRVAINDKGGSLAANAKLNTFATAINNLATSMGIGRNIKANSSSATSLTQDITIAANTTEAYVVVTSVYSGNSNSYSCARQSGASGTVTTQQSKSDSSWSQYGQVVVFSTITYKITKAKGSSSVVRITVSNPYGLQGFCVHQISH